MKDLILRIAFLMIVLILVPLVSILISDDDKPMRESKKIIKVYDSKNDKLFDTQLDEYIVGVVAAEMPASFHSEALKAQSVCARTYALRKVNSGLPEHNGADVCTDFSHCQAYYDDETMKEKWGKDYFENLNKIRKCVFDTSGEVITYNDEYAISVFHSCSNGKTENAKDVWGGHYPYLVSVDSIGDFENKNYSSACVVPQNEFIDKINTIAENKISSGHMPYIGDFIMTDGGNVGSVTIGDNSFSGIDIRKLFSLKSTSFTIETKDNDIVFTVHGNGHGVGLSQYGSNAMAQTGSAYDAILEHYYQGVKLQNMYN